MIIFPTKLTIWKEKKTRLIIVKNVDIIWEKKYHQWLPKLSKSVSEKKNTAILQKKESKSSE